MMVASGATTCTGRHLRWLATLALALVLIMLGGGGSRAMASPMRQLARSTTSFATDGIRYAAWQHSPVSPIVVFDTYTGSRREIKAPGCVLENEAPREDPEVIAGGGRFVLSCYKELRNGCFFAIYRHLLRCGEKLEDETALEKESRQQVQRLLDARTRTTTLLPEGWDWTRVGARSVEATAEFRPSACRALYSIATGTVTVSANPQICKRVDHPGVIEPVCRALRAKVHKAEASSSEFVYQGGLLVRLTHNYRNVQLERCHGHPIILPGPSEPTRHIVLVGPEGHHTTEPQRGGEPNKFDLRDGLLTWSTSHDPTTFDEFTDAIEYGTLTSYELASGRRRTWKLPDIPLYTGAEPPPSGVFGYSAHTVNTVFWIAARDMTGGEAGLCCVESSYLYAARF